VTPIPVPSAPPKARLSLAHGCSARTCRFTVTFAGGGSVEARVTVSGTVARQLHLGRRTIVSRSQSYVQPTTATVSLDIPSKVRRALSRRRVSSVSARLGVTALTSDGRRTDAHRAVRLKRR
jgi:hypothetical protein